jgi:phosphatidyl-myo-inositol dimannoside synthase
MFAGMSELDSGAVGGLGPQRPACDRVRVLVLTPDFPPARGGIQVLVHRLAAGLTGADVTVLTLASPGAERFDATAGVKVRRVSAPASLGAARNALLGARALGEALRLRPQVVLNMHIVTSPAAALIGRALRARTIQYFYAKEIGARPRLAAFAARNAHASVAISSYTEGLLRAVGVPPSARVRLIAPGVDLPSDPTPLPAVRPTLLTVSRLADPYKGHDVLIRALALVREQVPDVEWVVIGDGPLRAGLEELARSCGVADAVRFLGSVTDEQRDHWLRSAEVLAMPSRLPEGRLAGEGFGIVYLEAGAYGKPVVAGNVAGALDAVRDGETGLLVDPADAGAVAGAIVRLMRDPELAARLGRAGQVRARQFTWAKMVAGVESLACEQLGMR